MAPKLSASQAARIAQLESEGCEASPRFRRSQPGSSMGADLFAQEESGEDVYLPEQSEDDMSPQRHTEPNHHEDLLTVLGELWGFGQMSAQTAQRIAAAALRSPRPLIERIAKVGVSGANPNNAPRDFRNLIGDDSVPPTYEFTLRATDVKTKSMTLSRCKVMLPHEVFAWLYVTGRSFLFDEASSDVILADFWDATLASGDPHMANHPLRGDTRDWKRKAIPLLAYGDGTRYTQRESIEFVAWSFLLVRHASATSWATRYIAAAWAKTAEDGRDTWEQIWMVLVWSFDALFEGVHPIRDHRGDVFPEGSWAALRAGQPLTAEGHFGVIHRICGDLAWFNHSLWIKSFAPGAEHMCPFCEAGRHVHPFKDYSPNASWRVTLLRPPQPPPSGHPLFTLKGVDLFTLALDPMHVLDLGIFQHVIGNALFTLSYDSVGARWGQTPKDRMAAIWRRIQELYRRDHTSTRLSNLDLSFISVQSGPHAHYPQLRAKAAETRCLLPIVGEIVRETLGDLIPQSTHDYTVGSLTLTLRCLEGFMKVSDLIDTAPTVPGQKIGEQILAAMSHGLLHYSMLGGFAMYREKKLRWNVVNKHHFAHHLAERAVTLSPRLVWTYGFEDLVGRAQRAAHACAKANSRLALGNAFIEKYRFILAAAMQQELRRCPTTAAPPKKKPRTRAA